MDSTRNKLRSCTLIETNQTGMTAVAVRDTRARARRPAAEAIPVGEWSRRTSGGGLARGHARAARGAGDACTQVPGVSVPAWRRLRSRSPCPEVLNYQRRRARGRGREGMETRTGGHAGTGSVHAASGGDEGVAVVQFKMGMGRPGPGLVPGPMASRPILGVMRRSISPRCYGLDGPLGIMDRPKYFSIILNHEYYQHF